VSITGPDTMIHTGTRHILSIGNGYIHFDEMTCSAIKTVYDLKVMTAGVACRRGIYHQVIAFHGTAHDIDSLVVIVQSQFTVYGTGMDNKRIAIDRDLIVEDERDVFLREEIIGLRIFGDHITHIDDDPACLTLGKEASRIGKFLCA